MKYLYLLTKNSIVAERIVTVTVANHDKTDDIHKYGAYLFIHIEIILFKLHELSVVLL